MRNCARAAFTWKLSTVLRYRGFFLINVQGGCPCGYRWFIILVLTLDRQLVVSILTIWYHLRFHWSRSFHWVWMHTISFWLLIFSYNLLAVLAKGIAALDDPRYQVDMKILSFISMFARLQNSRVERSLRGQRSATSSPWLRTKGLERESKDENGGRDGIIYSVYLEYLKYNVSFLPKYF